MRIRSQYTFTVDEIRALLLECSNPDTRKGLLNLYDGLKEEGLTFIYTLDEPTMKTVRQKLKDVE